MLTGFNYDQPSNSATLTNTSVVTIIPAPTVNERWVQSLVAINQSRVQALRLEVWLYPGPKLIDRRTINPGATYRLVNPDQYILDTTQSIRVNLIDAATEKYLEVSAIWQDKWEYKTTPGIIDAWDAALGLQTARVSDGFRVERWLGQLTGLGFDNLLTPAKQPRSLSNGLNGKPYIEFVAARNDFLAATFGGLKAQPLSILMVADFKDAGSHIIDGIDAVNRIQILKSTTNLRVDAGTPQDTAIAGYLASNIHAFLLDDANSEMYWEGGANLLGASPGANGLAGVTLGADYQGNNGSTINVYELVLIETAFLSSALLARWGKEMGAKYRRPWA